MKDDCEAGSGIAAVESIPNTAAELPHPAAAARRDQNSQSRGGSLIGPKTTNTPADPTSCLAQIDAGRRVNELVKHCCWVVSPQGSGLVRPCLRGEGEAGAATMNAASLLESFPKTKTKRFKVIKLSFVYVDTPLCR